MNFRTAVKNLNKELRAKHPTTFSSSWILINTPAVYNYIRLNFRTENGDIDWDKVTVALDREFQRKWVRYRCRQVRQYENQTEVDCILNKYKDKLYVFFAALNKKDQRLRDKIIISLVRMAQKGNTLAQNTLTYWIKFIVDDWIDKYPQIWRWRGFSDPVEDKIAGCVRCYRYTGTFLGYLFKTLEYSSKALKPLYSLDDPVLDGSKTRIDYVILEQE
ncbi:MAG: hypothetical protein WC757_02590 [Candidatus Paceibacterota bacterium]|jgi:hypothetical protein